MANGVPTPTPPQEVEKTAKRGRSSIATVSEVSYEHLAGLRNSDYMNSKGKGKEGGQRFGSHTEYKSRNSARINEESKTMADRNNSLEAIFGTLQPKRTTVQMDSEAIQK